MKLLDSHVHLASDELYDEHEQIIADALAAGVEKMMLIALNPVEFKRALTLKEKYPYIFDIAYGLSLIHIF